MCVCVLGKHEHNYTNSDFPIESTTLEAIASHNLPDVEGGGDFQ